MIKPGTFEIRIQNDTIRFDMTAHMDFFGRPFQCNYIRKGIPIRKTIRGSVLSDLVKSYNLSKIIKITAESFDGHTAVFPVGLLKKGGLVVALNQSPESKHGAFTLYPIHDPFPNRIVKFLKSISIEM